MKKAITAFIAAAMAFTAVSCGRDKEVSPAAETVETAATEAVTTESVEEMIDEYLPEFDANAGINMAAEPMPETEEIPDEWHEVSDGKISFRVPADVKMDSYELDLGNGDTYRSNTAKSEDRKIFLAFFDGNDWSVEKEESTNIDSDLIDEDTIDFAKKNAEEKGYPQDGYITEEKTVGYLSELGLEYDGTRSSLYRALLDFSEKYDTEEHKEAFEYIATLKASMIGMVYPCIYYMEADGKPVYVHLHTGMMYDPSKKPEGKSRAVWVGAFASPNMEYTALVKGKDLEEALKIASTLKFVEEQG